MENSQNITIKNDLSEITKIADTIDLFGKLNRIDSTSIFEINLVMDEIAANVIRHGYKDNEEHYIEITITVSGNEFAAKIVDDGVEFNPLTHDKVDTNLSLQEKSIGGLGIHIIKKYMDKVEYKRTGSKNILQISKTVNVE